MDLTKSEVLRFKRTVVAYYSAYGRDLPWRRTDDPYAILVSEVMLQQTQVSRVLDKYIEWIRRFPTAKSLAAASWQDVLPLWTGLGYNRRARYLHQTAIEITRSHWGIFPNTAHALQQLPGIGPYTAAAVLVFAFNVPVPLVETNIRTVYIHHFFQTIDKVDDKAIRFLVEQTMDRHQPRRWFNALMDYGSFIKSQYPNPSRKSIQYTVQSPFKGSVREVRGYILKQITARQAVSRQRLIELFDERRVEAALTGLVKDGLIDDSLKP